MFGVSHSGDSLAGSSQTDDEALQMDLTQVPSRVDQIFMLLTIANGTFQNVKSAYARVCDQDTRQLARYSVTGRRVESGLIVGRLVREPGKRWGFQAVGKYCDRRHIPNVITKLFFTQ